MLIFVMGNLKSLCTTLFLLMTLFTTHTCSSSPPSTQEIQPQKNPSSTAPTTTLSHYHQVFYLKNKDPTMFVTRQERFNNRMMQRKKNKKMNNLKLKIKKKKKKKKMAKNLHQQSSSRPFSVMLPKGFVPPSGSSPCHNNQPNSLSSSFHCHLTTSAQP